MSSVKRVVGVPVRICGDQHIGWYPVRARGPHSSATRNVLFDIEIQFDGSGYVLCYESRDGGVYGDTRHETLSEAEQVAREDFGVEASGWRET